MVYPPVWKSKEQREEEELEKRKRELLEMQERVAEESQQQNPFDVWAGLGRGVSGVIHTPEFLYKPPRAEPTSYEDIPEASVNLPWKSPFTGEQAKLGTKGAAEWLPDIAAFSGMPQSIGLKLWRAFPFAGNAAEKLASVGARTVAAPIIATEEAPKIITQGVKKIFPTPLNTMMEKELGAKGETILYHGTKADFANADITTGKRMYGIHLTADEDVAKIYGKVKPYALSKDAKILDLSDGDTLWEFMRKEGILDADDLVNIDLERYVKDGQLFQYDISSKTYYADDVAKTAESLGYDVVKMPDDLGSAVENVAYVVTNKNVLKPPTPTPPTGMAKAPQGLISERTLSSDAVQIATGHKVAYAKNLLNKGTGVPTKTYRKMAEIYTGKSSMKQMTRDEADTFIKAISALDVKGGKPPKLPKTTALVDKKFWDEIPALKDIGMVDYLRQKPAVLKMLNMDDMADMLMRSELGLMEEKNIFWKELASMEKGIGKDVVRRERIFDAIENPIESHLLDPDEQGVFLYLKNFFDKWADDLALPVTERRKDYITHIFDKQLVLDGKEGRTLPLEILKALEFNYPKSTYMPFLKARIGQNVGLVKDPFKAAQVYESYALRDKYYQPFLQKLSAYIEMFQARGKMSTTNYLKDLARRVGGRPSKEDILIGNDISKFAKNLSKVIKGDAGLKLEQLANRGNLGSLIAYNMSSLYYTSWLGFRPVSAIRNLSQHVLAGADAGLDNLARGIGLRFTVEGKAALKESMVYRGRLLSEPVAGLEEEAFRKMPKAIQEKSLSFFKWADRQNVSDSFLTGYAKGKQLGLPREWAIKLGDEVAAETQYLYTKMARSLFEESVAGRFLSPFTSWTRNFTELFAKWAQGKPSAVIQQYMKETGKTVVERKFSREQLLTYMALLSGAVAVEGTTPIRATEYTGWTSVKNLGKMIGGDLPAWQVPAGLAQLVFGAMGGDETMMKEGWNGVKAIYPGIIRQLEDVAEGKADIMSLFMYLDRAEMEAAQSIRTRPTRERPTRTRERPVRKR